MRDRHRDAHQPGIKRRVFGALALVYPSKYEGFGLPLIEAMVEIQRPGTREMLIAAGYEQIEKLRWDTTAGHIQDVCEQVIRATQGRGILSA